MTNPVLAMLPSILLQVRVLGFGLLEDGDVGVGVLPEAEEVLVCSSRFGGVALNGIGTTELKMGQRASNEVHHNSSVIQELLELDGGRASIVRQQVSFAAQIGGVQRPGNLLWRTGQVVRSGGFQQR